MYFQNNFMKSILFMKDWIQALNTDSKIYMKNHGSVFKSV